MTRYHLKPVNTDGVRLGGFTDGINVVFGLVSMRYFDWIKWFKLPQNPPMKDQPFSSSRKAFYTHEFRLASTCMLHEFGLVRISPI